MSNCVLVIGQSGSGKSTSIRNLEPSSTFIINVLDKPLPFRNFKKNYPLMTKENKKGNYYASDNWANIIKCVEMVDKERPEITTLILDDWQYIIAHEFMRRVSEKGYDKFAEMGLHGWSVMNACLKTRDNLTSFILAHSEVDNVGKSKLKTIGKMLDEKMTLEGIFTAVLHARVVDGDYLFQTQTDNEYLAKTPMGLFDDLLIPNDLVSVKQEIEAYFNNEDN